MTSEPSPTDFLIQIELPSSQWLAIPGKPANLTVRLTNQGTTDEMVVLSVKGIPTNWLQEASQSVHLSPAEQKDVNLVITTPGAPASHAGRYPVQVQAVRPQDPSHPRTVEGVLTVAAFEVQGRIGVLMDATQFTVAPGGSVAVTFTLLNQGLEADTFRLAVEGIPVAWISTSTPAIRLNPSEQRQASILIQPPRAALEQGWPHTFHAPRLQPGSAGPAGRDQLPADHCGFRPVQQPADTSAGQSRGCVPGDGGKSG